MLSASSDQHFRDCAKPSLSDLPSLQPRQAVTVMADWYLNHRAEDCDLDDDGDMILFQWGTYNWGTGEHFEYNIDRQFIPIESGKPLQLGLTFSYRPSRELSALGEGNRWCHTPAELHDFLDFVNASLVTITLAKEKAEHVELTFEEVE
jgi:hypothetical protein